MTPGRPYRLAFLLLVLSLLFPRPSHAADVQFMCLAEATAEEVAAKLAASEGHPSTELARPYLESGRCVVLPGRIDVDITYRGKVFEGPVFNVRVVGFKIGGHDKPLYGLMPEVDDQGA